MAERAPLPISPPPMPRLTATAHPNDTATPLGTYVVQVPKEQIYRVPPPENAYLVEQYCNQNKTRRRSPCLACLKWILVAAAAVLSLLILSTIIFFATVRPGTPSFEVQHLSVKNAKGPRPKPDYNFMLSVKNPSFKMGYSYGAGGKAAITHKSIDIAAGTTPAFYQGQQNTTAFNLVLHGSNILLPKAIDRSLKGSKDVVSLELTAEFTATPKAGGMELWKMSMEVTCDVRVIGLVKEARIMSQECKSNLRL